MNRLSIALLALMLCAGSALGDEEPTPPKEGKQPARRPAADAPTPQVVQSHAVADLCSDMPAAESLAAGLRRAVPSATIKLQGHGALVVKASVDEQDMVAAWLGAERSRVKARPGADTRLRYFDVKDLVRKYDKLPARMKRLFPYLQAVEQKNGILIVRATVTELEAVTKDLDGLRRTLLADVPFVGRPGEAKKRHLKGVAEEWFTDEIRLRMPNVEEWTRIAPGSRTLEQRIESLRGEVRALRQEVRALRALLEQPKRRAPK